MRILLVCNVEEPTPSDRVLLCYAEALERLDQRTELFAPDRETRVALAGLPDADREARGSRLAAAVRRRLHERIIRLLDGLRPDLAISNPFFLLRSLSTGHWSDLYDALDRDHVPVVHMFLDPPPLHDATFLRLVETEFRGHPSQHTILTFDPYWREMFESLGVPAHAWLHACDPERFAAGEDPRQQDFDISFVGTVDDCPPSAEEPLSVQVWRWLEEGLEHRFLLHEKVAASTSGWTERARTALYSRCLALATPLGHRQRWEILKTLGLPLHLFTWRRNLGTRAPGDRTILHDGVPYGTETAGIYRRSAVNLNLTLPNMDGGLNQRVFDVGAAGGFLLTDRRQDLARLSLDWAPMTYSGVEELGEKCRHFLRHPDQRHRLAGELRSCVLNDHTYLHRARRLLDLLRRE